jgi:hypothetical protein
MWFSGHDLLDESAMAQVERYRAINADSQQKEMENETHDSRR